jgi:hypothetical protein
VAKMTNQNIEARKKYYPTLKKLIEDIGDWNINASELSREWHVPKRTVHNWRNKILAEMDLIDPVEYGREIIGALKTSIKQCRQKVITVTQERDRIKYHNTIAKLSDSLTDMLERYEKKMKVADKIELETKGLVRINFNDSSDNYPKLDNIPDDNDQNS